MGIMSRESAKSFPSTFYRYDSCSFIFAWLGLKWEQKVIATATLAKMRLLGGEGKHARRGDSLVIARRYVLLIGSDALLYDGRISKRVDLRKSLIRRRG